MPAFKLVSDFLPMGDQPEAIRQLVDGLEKGHRHQTLLGATATTVVVRYSNSVRTPRLPSWRMSESDATPRITDTATSGTATSFNRRRKISPKGSIQSMVKCLTTVEIVIVRKPAASMVNNG